MPTKCIIPFMQMVTMKFEFMILYLLLNAFCFKIVGILISLILQLPTQRIAFAKRYQDIFEV